ncbi:MAG: pentapeptide repeat-containing protein [Bacteroidetes bacterium]|nr:pentapeptide repeat-containing protein [Bacteroidota bacterium]
MAGLEGDDFEDRTFEKIDLAEQRITGKSFTNCTFASCTFTKTIFRECTFEDCTFDRCDLSMVQVKGSTFSQIKLTGCKVIGVLWFDIRIPFARHAFTISCTDTNISYSSFFGMNLKKAKFTRCVAKEVDWSECQMQEAELQGCDLEGARFSGTDLSGADLRGAHSYQIDIAGTKLKGAKFSLPEATVLLDSLGIHLH